MPEYTGSLLVATIALADNLFVYLLRLYLIQVGSCTLLVRAVGPVARREMVKYYYQGTQILKLSRYYIRTSFGCSSILHYHEH
jgi:hypothetical protein